MKTRDKIVQASIELFNEKGERNVTTNHIAAHLGISPGNLYYHFRNKEDIILSIYEECSRHLLEDTFIQVSPDIKPLDSIILYMDEAFKIMRKYSFLYSNLAVLLAKSPQLHEKYVVVQQVLAGRVSDMLLSLRSDNMISFQDDDLSDIVSILRLVNTFWVSFYQTQNYKSEVNDAVFYEGVLKILVILRPYTVDSALAEFREAREMYRLRLQAALQEA